MSKKITALACISLLTLVLVFTSLSNKSPFPNFDTTNIKIDNQTIKLYVADTDEKRNQGLSGVKKLNQNEGMIFVFDQKGKHQFWMKDMYIDLDFIFLDGNKVVDVIKDVSHDSYPKIIQGKGLYNRVIELPFSTKFDGHIKSIDTGI